MACSGPLGQQYGGDKSPVQRDRVTGSNPEALMLMCRRHGLMRIAVTVLKARA